MNHNMVRRKRRGISSMVEAVACIVMFALLLMVLIELLSLSVNLGATSQATVILKEESDEFIETIQLDVKSAESMDAVGEQLTITKDGRHVVYRIEEGTIYRDTEPMLTGLEVGAFIPTDDNAVTVAIKFVDGGLLDINLHR